MAYCLLLALLAVSGDTSGGTSGGSSDGSSGGSSGSTYNGTSGGTFDGVLTIFFCPLTSLSVSHCLLVSLLLSRGHLRRFVLSLAYVTCRIRQYFRRYLGAPSGTSGSTSGFTRGATYHLFLSPNTS